ncbi:MAG: hypothetical protein K9L21_00560 [Spirochaetia bacterium]|nr:hypothetical protein [Spirochaetia bacterium]
MQKFQGEKKIRTKKSSRLTVLLFTLLLSVLFFSCTQTPPEILSSDFRIRLLYNPARKTDQSIAVRSFLAIHLEVEDREAADAVELLHIMPEDSFYNWSLDADALEIVEIDARTWVGTSAVSMPETMLLPAGDYQVEIETLRGELAETVITLPRQELFTKFVTDPKKYFPAVTFDKRNGCQILTAQKQKVVIRGFDSSEVFIGGFIPDAAYISFDTEESRLLRSYHSFYVSIRDAETGIELVTGPLKFEYAN